jgi:uncharacterized repeat protein (TIGR03847 family)
MRVLGTAEIFRAGAIGEPGRRTFYLEVDDEWFVLEKEQVAAIAAHALELVAGLDTPAQEPGDLLGHPGEPTFRVGEIGMGYGAGAGAIGLTAVEDEDEEAVTFLVSPEQLDAMARRALLVVAAGRPPCPFCGLPRDAEDHACPASNGDRRRS